MQWRTSVAVFIVTLSLASNAGAAATYKVLYNFQGGRNGFTPQGALISDALGNLYGVTVGGGDGESSGCGTVFELRRMKNGWTQNVLYRFPADGNDGCSPSSNLAFDAKGNLYGTTPEGGQGECSGQTCGIVFELTSTLSGTWKETVLHRFAGGSDGANPGGGVIIDTGGNVYGVTQNGGGTSCACGTVFKLSPQTDGSWEEEILHSFSGSDGGDPNGLVFDGGGNLYGVGGIGGDYDVGVAFELSPASGGKWNETVIYSFGSDGEGPVSGLTLTGRNLYGATIVGGTNNWGTVFELKHESNGTWSHSVLYDFTGGKDGRYPMGLPVFDKSGNLYGATTGDVSCLHKNRWACGNVFKLAPQSDGSWKFQVLHTFPGGKAGAIPSEPVFDGKSGLYDVAYDGGNGKCAFGWGCGLAFQLAP